MSDKSMFSTPRIFTGPVPATRIAHLSYLFARHEQLHQPMLCHELAASDETHLYTRASTKSFLEYPFTTRPDAIARIRPHFSVCHVEHRNVSRGLCNGSSGMRDAIETYIHVRWGAKENNVFHQAHRAQPGLHTAPAGLRGSGGVFLPRKLPLRRTCVIAASCLSLLLSSCHANLLFQVLQMQSMQLLQACDNHARTHRIANECHWSSTLCATPQNSGEDFAGLVSTLTSKSPHPVNVVGKFDLQSVPTYVLGGRPTQKPHMVTYECHRPRERSH